MHQELQNLIRDLRNEKCPPAVLARVRHQISRETAPSSFGRSVASAVGLALVLGTVALWLGHARHEAQRVAAEEKSRRVRVMHETQAAFGYIGQALIRAAAHTENALTKEALPPLQDSFELVKNKLTNPI